MLLQIVGVVVVIFVILFTIKFLTRNNGKFEDIIGLGRIRGGLSSCCRRIKGLFGGGA